MSVLASRPLALALALVAVMRVLLAVLGAVTGAHPVDDGMRDFADSLTAPGSAWRPLFLPWDHYDSIALTDIAAHGYRHGDNPTNAFYPLFPALTSMLGHAFGGHVVLAGLVLSTVSAVIGLAILHRLFSPIAGPQTAALAVVLVAVSPFGFVLLAAYTEALFLALSAGAFLAMQRRHPLLAGLLAGAAAGSRIQGLIVAAALLLAVVLLWRTERTPRAVVFRDAVAVLLPAILVSSAFFAYEVLVLRQPGGPWGAQHWYGRHGLAMPWTVIWDSIHSLRASGHPEEVFNLLLLAVVLIAAPAMARRLPAWWTAYALASMLLLLFHRSEISPLLSVGRFTVVLFPVMIAAASVSKKTPLLAGALVAVSAALLVGRFVTFAHGTFVG